MIKDAVKLLVQKQDISAETAETVMNEIMSGEASDIEISAYLTALRTKGETIEEITASARGMRNACKHLLHEMDVLEIVGTGGDEAYTFNISTITGFIISAAGVPVAKHGNRSVSSKCGAADILESLGANITIEPEKSAEILKNIGFCFMFAQKYHPSMKYVANVRKTLGIRTMFNVLGPLSNPAGANMELMGVYDKSLIKPLAQVMANLGVKSGMVVHGSDGLDEITMTGITYACIIKNGSIEEIIINPEDYGFNLCDSQELVGGAPEINKQIALDILSGKEIGAKRDVVLLNAGVCLFIADKASSIPEGIAQAESALSSGAAFNKLEKYIKLSNS